MKMDQFGNQNFSNPSGSLHALNRFQDLYYSGPLQTSTPPPISSPIPTFTPGRFGLSINPQHDFSHRQLFTGGNGGGGGNSAAISALGLLAFLFFLNLIQNSLINNRWNLLEAAVNATRLASGRSLEERLLNMSWVLDVESEPIGRTRQRRSPRSTNSTPLKTPASISIDPMELEQNVFNDYNRSRIRINSYLLNHTGGRKRFKRQLVTNANVVPISCAIQFYVCRVSRVIQGRKRRLLGKTKPNNLARRFVRVRDRAGNIRILEALIPLTNQQPRRSCRTVFNQCRNGTITPITLG